MYIWCGIRKVWYTMSCFLKTNFDTVELILLTPGNILPNRLRISYGSIWLRNVIFVYYSKYYIWVKLMWKIINDIFSINLCTKSRNHRYTTTNNISMTLQKKRYLIKHNKNLRKLVFFTLSTIIHRHHWFNRLNIFIYCFVKISHTHMLMLT